MLTTSAQLIALLMIIISNQIKVAISHFSTEESQHFIHYCVYVLLFKFVTFCKIYNLLASTSFAHTTIGLKYE